MRFHKIPKETANKQLMHINSALIAASENGEVTHGSYVWFEVKNRLVILKSRNVDDLWIGKHRHTIKHAYAASSPIQMLKRA